MNEVPGLSAFATDVTSQFGEDGIIAEIFNRIGIENRWCFECGASDGVKYSNMQQWIRQDWYAVLVEMDDDKYQKLQAIRTKKVHTIHVAVTVDGETCIDSILRRCGAPKNIDLLVIDVDGQDYELFDSVQAYTPRVVMVEFAFGTRGKGDIQERFKNGSKQACMAAIVALGHDKGYDAVAVTTVNAIFVRSDLVEAVRVKRLKP